MSNEIGQEYGVHPAQVRQWKKAIQNHQFTSTAFTDVLKRKVIKISMDGKGRALEMSTQ